MDDLRQHEEQEQPQKEQELEPKRERQDFPRRDNHREEYAAEVAPPKSTRYEIDESTDGEQEDTWGRTAGYISVACGVVSLFMWSIVLGPIAAATASTLTPKEKKRGEPGAWGLGFWPRSAILSSFRTQDNLLSQDRRRPSCCKQQRGAFLWMLIRFRMEEGELSKYIIFRGNMAYIAVA